MASTPAFGGADSVSLQVQGAAAFGHALVGTVPESRYEAMPGYDSISGTFLTAEARLDNRDDLLACFRIPSGERAVVPDSRLLALCFAGWGEAAPDHLYGDWSLAAWSERERRLFLARDRVGVTGLYVHHSPHLAVFSSSLSSLLAHPDLHCELDELAIARYLINPHRLRYPLPISGRIFTKPPGRGSVLCLQRMPCMFPLRGFHRRVTGVRRMHPGFGSVRGRLTWIVLWKSTAGRWKFGCVRFVRWPRL